MHGYAAAVSFYGVFYNSQPQTGTFDFTGVVCTVETVENIGQGMGWDADAVICDRYFSGAVRKSGGAEADL